MMITDIKRIFPGYQQLNPTGGPSSLVFSAPRSEGFLAGDSFSIKRDTADDAVVFSYSNSPNATNNEFSTLEELKALIDAQYSDAITVINQGELSISFEITGVPPVPSATQSSAGLKSSFAIGYDATPLGGVNIADGDMITVGLANETTTPTITFKYQTTPAQVAADVSLEGIDYTAQVSGTAGNGIEIQAIETDGGTVQGQTKSVSITETTDPKVVQLDIATSQGYAGQAGAKPYFDANDLKVEWNTEEEFSVNNVEIFVDENASVEGASESASQLNIDLTASITTYTSTEIKAILDAASLSNFTATDSSTVTATNADFTSNAGVTFTAVNAGAGGNSLSVEIQDNQAGSGVTGIDLSATIGNAILIKTELAITSYTQGDLETAFNSAGITSLTISIANAATSLTTVFSQTFLTGGVNAGTVLSGWANGVTALQGGSTPISPEASFGSSDYTLQEIIDAVNASSSLVTASITTGTNAGSPFSGVANYPISTSGGQEAGFSNAEQLAAKIAAHFSGQLQVNAEDSTILETISNSTRTLSLSYQGTPLTSQDMFYISSSTLGYGATDYWGSIVATEGSASSGESDSFNYTEKYIAIPLADLVVGSNLLTAEESDQISGDYRKVAYHFVRKHFEYLNSLEHIAHVEIISQGTEYRSGDTIEIGDIKLTLSVDGNGSITDVLYNGSSVLESNNPTPFGSGFTSAPILQINSSTGQGGEIIATITSLNPDKMDISKGSLSENTQSGELTRPFSITFTFNEAGLELANEN